MRFRQLLAFVGALLLTLPLAARDLDWSIGFSTPGTLFPSAIIAFSGLPVDASQLPDTHKGDPLAAIFAEIVSPANNAKVTVTISEGPFFKESSITTTLPYRGVTYRVAPTLKYDTEKLLKNKQLQPDLVTIKVKLGSIEEEQSQRYTVRSINECLLGYIEGDEFVDYKLLFAAYVNENNPKLDNILGQALKKGYVKAFMGYQGTSQDVADQVAAIYQTLRDLGFHYSSITDTPSDSQTIFSQHVRLVGESLSTSQANCIDGTVIFASLFKKIGLNPVIITVPGHAFVGVYLTSDNRVEGLLPIETTVVGSADVNQSITIAKGNMQKYRAGFYDAANNNCLVIDVRDARRFGILPITEL